MARAFVRLRMQVVGHCHRHILTREIWHIHTFDTNKCAKRSLLRLFGASKWQMLCYDGRGSPELERIGMMPHTLG